MKKLDFIALSEIDDEDDVFFLNVGDTFLMGESVIEQKVKKDVGDDIVFFVSQRRARIKCLMIRFTKKWRNNNEFDCT